MSVSWLRAVQDGPVAGAVVEGLFEVGLLEEDLLEEELFEEDLLVEELFEEDLLEEELFEEDLLEEELLEERSFSTVLVFVTVDCAAVIVDVTVFVMCTLTRRVVVT